MARQQQSPPTDGEAAALSGLRNAVTSVNMLSDEMTSKRSELQSLQKQLGDMKKLLEVTTAARQEVCAFVPSCWTLYNFIFYILNEKRNVCVYI